MTSSIPEFKKLILHFLNNIERQPIFLIIGRYIIIVGYHFQNILDLKKIPDQLNPRSPIFFRIFPQIPPIFAVYKNNFLLCHF